MNRLFWQKSHCMEMASSYSSVLLPEGRGCAAASDFHDKNEVLLLFPPARLSELVELGQEFAQQQQSLGENHPAERSCPPGPTYPEGWEPQGCPQTPLSMWQRISQPFPSGLLQSSSFKRSLFDILLIYCVSKGDLKYFNGNNSFKGLNQ